MEEHDPTSKVSDPDIVHHHMQAYLQQQQQSGCWIMHLLTFYIVLSTISLWHPFKAELF